MVRWVIPMSTTSPTFCRTWCTGNMIHVSAIFGYWLQTHVPSFTMLHSAWGYRGTWTLFVLVLSPRLLAAQMDQYYAVSKDTFLDIVANKCEHRVFRSNRTTQCILSCARLAFPRCFASALGPGYCWVCGDAMAELYPNKTLDAAAFWMHSGGYENMKIKCVLCFRGFGDSCKLMKIDHELNKSKTYLLIKSAVDYTGYRSLIIKWTYHISVPVCAILGICCGTLVGL